MWEGESRWQVLAGFAEKLLSVRGAHEAGIEVAVGNVEQIVLGVQAAAEHVGKQEEFSQFLESVLAGEGPAPSTENAEELQDNIELFDLFAAMVSTADLLSKSLESRRSNDAIKTEMLDRVILCKKASHLHYASMDEVAKDSLEILKSWSDIFAEHSLRGIADTVLTSQPVAMKLLCVLRKTGYDALIGMFLQEHFAVAVIAKTQQNQPHLLLRAMQKLEVLPAAHRDVILRANAFEKVHTVNEKLVARKNVGLTDHALIMAQHVSKLRGEAAGNAPALGRR